MRPTELRGLSDAQLAEELENARREMFNLRFRQATRQLENPRQIGAARKNIARILTIARQRELARGGE
jgi:large subunit ribosomal protein L29